MSFSEPAMKRKVDDMNRQFHKKQKTGCFFVEHLVSPICIEVTEKVVVLRKLDVITQTDILRSMQSSR